MGFWSNVFSRLNGGGVTVFSPRVTYVGAGEAYSLDPSELTAARMWRTQPHLHTVVDFLARNTAQLGLHCFLREGESDRRRDRDSALAKTLGYVDGTMTTYELIYTLVGDLALYDRAYWLFVASESSPSGYMLRRLPPSWVEPVAKNAWEVDYFQVWAGGSAEPAKIPVENVISFPGYSPTSPLGCSPAVESLRGTLMEQLDAAEYRRTVWKRGGRVSAVLERPIGAPPWSDGAREAFREDWRAKYTGSGDKVGGTPILEDGMKLQRVDFSAHDQQYVEAAKLSLVTVASAFHVNPTMIGHNDGANYSNVREFRKMLYGDTLGPILARIEDRLNAFLAPVLAGDGYYVEFNTKEKLRGSFEEQAASLQASTGAPWMTRNEARATQNLPALDGGNELITPLNVLIGGQASPLDSGSQNRRAAPAPMAKALVEGVKERATDSEQDDAAGVFAKFFARQRRALASKLGAKSADWWDQGRWDRELSGDLLAYALGVSVAVAERVIDDLGEDPAGYDVGRTKNFLKKVTERIAGQVNQTTYLALEDALGEEDSGEAVTGVFDIAESSRAEKAGITLATTVASFATAEAGKQVLGPRAYKRWVVNSSNPRASHAAMNGEEVPIDEPFSNGLMWPGSFDGDVDEVAGCQCSIEVIAK